MPKYTITVKGISVSYSDSGKGTAIVCLHGFLETKSMWKPLKETLIKKGQEQLKTFDTPKERAAKYLEICAELSTS